MTMVPARPDLFAPPAEPVFGSAAVWFASLVTGPVAIAIAIIAVAAAGMLLMAGRLRLWDAVRIMLGCFILLGASTIAAGLLGLSGSAQSQQAAGSRPEAQTPPRDLPPAAYDPYAGASVPTE